MAVSTQAHRPAAPVHPSNHLAGAKDFTTRASVRIFQPARCRTSSPRISSWAQRRTFHLLGCWRGGRRCGIVAPSFSGHRKPPRHMELLWDQNASPQSFSVGLCIVRTHRRARH